jgi:hypothetical protein
MGTRVMATAMAIVTAMTWTMVAAMRLAVEEEGKGKSSKGNGKGDEGGG